MTSEEIQSRLGENIRSFRKQKKLTQFELAEITGLSEATIKSIELQHNYPNKDTLALISTALDIDVYKLFLPVPSSFEITDEVRVSVQKAASDGYKQFMQGIADSLNVTK